MNIIRMTGGLGNQMFQYALYLKLCAMGKEVKFDDVSEYQKDNARPIMLWVFGINYPKATQEEINEITDGFLYLTHRIRRKLTGRRTLEYHEQDCNFDENILKKEPAYLTGYFQSEKYFKDIEQEVRKAFVFQETIYESLLPELKEKVTEYQQKIENTNAVSLHIRRGDYLENDKVFGGNCTEAYYESAIAYIKEKYSDAVFFVFSNDIQWCGRWLTEKQFLKGSDSKEPFILIQGMTEDSGYLDLMLMSKCRHHIIANSSFSWWGAWLNPGKNKTVIAPAKWYNNRECRDIYTKEMIRMDSMGKVVQEAG